MRGARRGTNYIDGLWLVRQRTSQFKFPEATVYVENSKTGKEVGRTRTSEEV